LNLCVYSRHLLFLLFSFNYNIKWKFITRPLLSEKKKKYSYLDNKEFQKDKAYFQEALKEIENVETELLDTESYNQSMNIFVEELKAKYGNN